MRIIEAVALIFCWMVSSAALFAEKVHVDEVAGQALYGKSGATAMSILLSQTDVEEGSTLTTVNGDLFASPSPGSEFHLTPLSTVKIESNGLEAQPGGGWERKTVLLLSQGKLTGAFRANSGETCCYNIQIEGGTLSVKNGIFVVCVHGDGAHIYVAKGFVTLYPLKGPYHETGIRLMARSSIGVLSNDGELEIQPRTQVAVGTNNCLLSGVSREIVEHLEEGAPNPANLKGNPPVSAIQ